MHQYINTKVLREFMKYSMTFVNEKGNVNFLTDSPDLQVYAQSTTVATIQGVIHRPVSVNPIDLSDPAICDVAGKTFPVGSTIWLTVLMDRDSNPKVLYTEPDEHGWPKTPAFDPLTYACYGWIKVTADLGNPYVVGTTVLSQTVPDVTVDQAQAHGPVFPHPDNVDRS